MTVRGNRTLSQQCSPGWLCAAIWEVVCARLSRNCAAKQWHCWPCAAIWKLSNGYRASEMLTLLALCSDKNNLLRAVTARYYCKTRAMRALCSDMGGLLHAVTARCHAGPAETVQPTERGLPRALTARCHSKMLASLVPDATRRVATRAQPSHIWQYNKLHS